MGKPNRDILSGGVRYRKRKSKSHRVEEVTFDKGKRAEFLKGFHKRKMQRRKHAEEVKEKQKKLDRLEERARIREGRRQRVEDRLAELKRINEELEGDGDDDDDDDDWSDKTDRKDKKSKKDKKDKDTKASVESIKWYGFDDSGDDADKPQSNGKSILKVKQVYDVKDEEAPVVGKSEVTIEALDNPSEQTVKLIAAKNHVDLSRSDEVLAKSISRAKEYARLMGMEDESEEEERKKRRVRKKRRYLSKRERKLKKGKDRRASMHKHNRL